MAKTTTKQPFDVKEPIMAKTTTKQPFDVKEAMTTALNVAKDMGVLGFGQDVKPLTPKQAAAAEKKAKKDHAKWMAEHKKQEMAEKRFALFCNAYPLIRLVAIQRDPSIDKKDVVKQAWKIVDEMMEQAPAKPEYTRIGTILSGCGH